MRESTLLALRITMGLFLAVWGADKLIHVEHGQQVAEHFYSASLSAAAMRILGAAQVGAGLLVMLGAARRVAYALLLLVTGATLLAVWRSVVDPLGLMLEGGNIVFFSSVVIFAAAAVLWSFTDDDRYTVDRWLARRRPRSHPSRLLRT